MVQLIKRNKQLGMVFSVGLASCGNTEPTQQFFVNGTTSCLVDNFAPKPTVLKMNRRLHDRNGLNYFNSPPPTTEDNSKIIAEAMTYPLTVPPNQRQPIFNVNHPLTHFLSNNVYVFGQLPEGIGGYYYINRKLSEYDVGLLNTRCPEESLDVLIFSDKTRMNVSNLQSIFIHETLHDLFEEGTSTQKRNDFITLIESLWRASETNTRYQDGLLSLFYPRLTSLTSSFGVIPNHMSTLNLDPIIRTTLPELSDSERTQFLFAFHRVYMYNIPLLARLFTTYYLGFYDELNTEEGEKYDANRKTFITIESYPYLADKNLNCPTYEPLQKYYPFFGNAYTSEKDCLNNVNSKYLDEQNLALFSELIRRVLPVLLNQADEYVKKYGIDLYTDKLE